MQNGKCSTPKISECHKTEKGASLSDILEADHCKSVYEIIKDYDDDICYGYCGRSDCAMFKDFKQLIKDGADTEMGIEWY